MAAFAWKWPRLSKNRIVIVRNVRSIKCIKLHTKLKKVKKLQIVKLKMFNQTFYQQTLFYQTLFYQTLFNRDDGKQPKTFG